MFPVNKNHVYRRILLIRLRNNYLTGQSDTSRVGAEITLCNLQNKRDFSPVGYFLV